ncbi:MAG: RES domain-containing protein [Balneolaceae bacterium]|nr:RES domain-containing protein [Balneolaceae bacterium]
MILFRLVTEPYHEDISGSGAKKFGGRWNRKGFPVLYTSEHASLAVLEILAQSTFNSYPLNLKLITIAIPEDGAHERFDTGDLPANWRAIPAPGALADLGTEWLKSRRTLFMRVPSVLVPQENNILVNPAHAQFERVMIREINDFTMDPRLRTKG